MTRDHLANIKLGFESNSCVVFEPKTFDAENGPLLKRDYTLNQSELEELSKKARKFRSEITLRAERVAMDLRKNKESLELEKKELDRRLYRYQLMKDFKLTKDNINCISSMEFQRNPIRKRKFFELKDGEKSDIIYRVIVKHESHEDVARQFNVAITTVGVLIKKAKDNRNYISEIIAKTEAKEQVKDLVIDTANQIHQCDQAIWST